MIYASGIEDEDKWDYHMLIKTNEKSTLASALSL